MGNKLNLKPVSDLLGMNFFVPSYQRGYRWTAQQVKDLLNDIYSFAVKKNKSTTEFYCLQPIVVKKCSEEEKENKELRSELDSNTWYEVIDGQQRLTTIHILFSYLVKELYKGESLYARHKKHPFQIEYETRKDSKQFLNDIAQQTKQQREDDIDFYFFADAFTTIESWFSKRKDPQEALESIRNTLICGLNNQKLEGVVQVIWYEIDDTINPIDTFIRINMGKIPLRNAELIKALFLQEKNFGNTETAVLRKVSIAKEWDNMEYALGNEDFWWFLNKSRNDAPARIEFLFDVIRDIEKGQYPDIGTDKDATFRLFYNKFSDFDEGKEQFKEVENQWSRVKEYFLAFEEWYNHSVWYHYIGFLIYAKCDVVGIYNLYKGKTKDSFTQSLKEKIKEVLKVSCTKEDDSYNIDLKYENNNKDKIRELLLLYNIQYIVNQYTAQDKQNGSAVYMKFPFKLFKNELWDIEHVDSFTPNPIKNKKTADEWLKAAKKDLKIDGELTGKIDEFINGKDSFSQFEELQNEIIKIAGESENDEDLKNSIGNLTLLDAGTNRSYGNALFPTKRRIIIEKDSEGTFIPVCTKNVFLKNFTKEQASLSQWEKKDINNYQNHIGQILEEFLTINTK